MLDILILFVLGIIAGFIFRNKKQIVKFSSKLSIWSVYLLLLILGISVGSNDQIINNFKTLGISGISIGLLTVTFSILFAGILFWIYQKWWNTDKLSHNER